MHAAGAVKSASLPVAFVENSSHCATNSAGEKVIGPNKDRRWLPELMAQVLWCLLFACLNLCKFKAHTHKQLLHGILAPVVLLHAMLPRFAAGYVSRSFVAAMLCMRKNKGHPTHLRFAILYRTCISCGLKAKLSFLHVAVWRPDS